MFSEFLQKGYYKEILNSNAVEYGGSGIGNMGGVHSEDVPRFEFQNSIKVTLPPLAVNIYEFEPEISVKSEPELNESSEPELNELSELHELKETPEVVSAENEPDPK